MVAGSVSGGCIEDDLIDKARQRRAGRPVPQVVRYGIDADAAHRFGLPCGGLIELVLEPVAAAHPPARAAGAAVERRRARAPRADIASGDVALEPGRPHRRAALTDTTLTTHHGPSWRLLLIGAGQMTQYLAQMAQALGYQVWCATRARNTPPASTSRRHAAAHHARRHRHRAAARRPHRHHRAHARPQARRPGADGGAALAGLLRGRHRLAREPGQAQGAAEGTLRPDRRPADRICTARWA
jgi:xanthine/CO dehydrogenase XdhC/CoxF family maturation factor